MGQTYAKAFLRSQITTPEQLMILEKDEEKAASLLIDRMGSVHFEPESCLPKADLVILAVKPQDSEALFKAIAPFVGHQQLYLSIMAGVQIATIGQGLKVEKIIRAMPNLPAQIGRGMTAFTSSEPVTRIELITVQNLLNTTGKTLYVADEQLIDASTAISGSGPAYVWFYMNALMEAARKMGFSNSEAELLVGQTFLGATELYQATNYSCAEWIQRVSSKGGTTEAAMATYQATTVQEDIIAGAEAALQRAVDLGSKESK